MKSKPLRFNFSSRVLFTSTTFLLGVGSFLSFLRNIDAYAICNDGFASWILFNVLMIFNVVNKKEALAKKMSLSVNYNLCQQWWSGRRPGAVVSPVKLWEGHRRNGKGAEGDKISCANKGQ